MQLKNTNNMRFKEGEKEAYLKKLVHALLNELNKDHFNIFLIFSYSFHIGNLFLIKNRNTPILLDIIFLCISIYGDFDEEQLKKMLKKISKIRKVFSHEITNFEFGSYNLDNLFNGILVAIVFKQYVQKGDRQNLESVHSIVSTSKIEGLEYQLVPGDGHCLFHAVGLHVDEDQMALRQSVATYIEQHKSELKGSISALLAEGRTLQDYLEALRNGQEWADHIEIGVLMRIYNRPIVIIGPNGEIRNRVDIEGIEGEPIFVYYNGHNHYDAYVLTEEYHDCSPREILMNLTQLSEHPQNFKGLFVQFLNQEINSTAFLNKVNELLAPMREHLDRGADQIRDELDDSSSQDSFDFQEILEKNKNIENQLVVFGEVLLQSHKKIKKICKSLRINIADIPEFEDTISEILGYLERSLSDRLEKSVYSVIQLYSEDELGFNEPFLLFYYRHIIIKIFNEVLIQVVNLLEKIDRFSEERSRFSEERSRLSDVMASLNQQIDLIDSASDFRSSFISIFHSSALWMQNKPYEVYRILEPLIGSKYPHVSWLIFDRRTSKYIYLGSSNKNLSIIKNRFQELFGQKIKISRFIPIVRMVHLESKNTERDLLRILSDSKLSKVENSETLVRKFLTVTNRGVRPRFSHFSRSSLFRDLNPISVKTKLLDDKIIKRCIKQAKQAKQAWQAIRSVSYTSHIVLLQDNFEVLSETIKKQKQRKEVEYITHYSDGSSARNFSRDEQPESVTIQFESPKEKITKVVYRPSEQTIDFGGDFNYFAIIKTLGLLYESSIRAVEIAALPIVVQAVVWAIGQNLGFRLYARNQELENPPGDKEMQKFATAFRGHMKLFNGDFYNIITSETYENQVKIFEEASAKSAVRCKVN